MIPQVHPSMKLTNQNNSNGGLTYSVNVQSSTVEMNYCLSLLLVLLITDIALITAGMVEYTGTLAVVI